jgi:hypothetical protein
MKWDRIICPFHKEDTPSLVLYESGDGFCFGACYKRYSAEELGRKPVANPVPRKVENIPARMEAISKLPIGHIRGLKLPYDRHGYYIVWPTMDYYRYRKNVCLDGGSKYVGPAGHSPPLFYANLPGSQTAILCEGEINALSLAAAFPELDVMSPGGAGNFNENFLSKYLPRLSKYASILMIADDDDAGIGAIIKGKTFLIRYVPKLPVLLMPRDRDANDWLMKYGKEGLRKEITQAMGVQEGVSRD